MTSFVYFDIGGVAIKDFSKSNKWDIYIKDLGVTTAQLPQFDAIWDQYDDQLSLDQDVDDLVQLISRKLNLNLPSDFSAMDRFIDRFEPNKSLWPIINQLKQQVGVGLLTNMYPGMLAQINRANLLPQVSWDAVVDSSKEMVKKPDPKIYEIAEHYAQVIPPDILFIDNNQDNLQAATARGWQTFFYDSADYEQSTKKLDQFLRQHNILL